MILACRSKERGEEAKRKIIDETKNTEVEVMHLDLSSFTSIRSFVTEFNEKQLPLHVLVNNASIFSAPYGKTTDGFESHFQVNYLGPWLLTNLLTEKLKESSPSRIINVCSQLHWLGTRNVNKITNDKKFRHGVVAYGRSKLAVAASSYKLSKILQPAGVNVNIGISLPLLLIIQL